MIEKAKKSSKTGNTLLESLIAMALIAIILVPLLDKLPSMLAGNKLAEERSHLVFIARNVVEVLSTFMLDYRAPIGDATVTSIASINTAPFNNMRVNQFKGLAAYPDEYWLQLNAWATSGNCMIGVNVLVYYDFNKNGVFDAAVDRSYGLGTKLPQHLSDYRKRNYW